MPTLAGITPRQATFLNKLADTAKDYKRSLSEIASFAETETERVLHGHRSSGPSHQTLFELQANYGALNALLNTIWLVFDVTTIEDEELRVHYRDSVDEWVNMAVTGVSDDDYSVWFEAEQK